VRKLVVLTAALAVITGGGTSTAKAYLIAKPKDHTLKARLASQKVNLKHAKYVCRHGHRAHKRWACKAVKWLAAEYRETQLALKPRSNGPFAIDSCTRALLGREGGMNPHASNPSTGAYGGPQALPGTKMSTAGADWKDNIWTQIKWMIGYMESRYGGSCDALSHSYAFGWY
jgi:hypothetical protein